MEEHKRLGYKILQSVGARPQTVVMGASIERMCMYSSGIECENALDWLIDQEGWLEQLQGAPLMFKLTQAGQRKAKTLRGWR